MAQRPALLPELVIIIGIDPGFAALGLAVLELRPTSTRVLYHETFKTRSTDDDGDRLDSIAERLLDLIEEHEPEALGYENQAGVLVGKSERDQPVTFASMRVHEVAGIIRCAARAFDLPVYCMAPSTVKCAVLGKGGSRAKKGVVKDRVRQLFHLGQCSEHVADAVAIGVGAAVRHRRHVSTLTRHVSLIH